MSDGKARSPKRPAPWLKHLVWRLDRAFYRLRGRRALSTTRKRGWGALHLTAIGRTSGKERGVILGYVRDDDLNLVTLAMNGWDEGHPAWWLNLEAHPDAVVQLAHGSPFRVRAHAAVGEERRRLWQRWATVDHDLDAYAAQRSATPAVVVLEPRR